MRLTREALLKTARDAANQRARVSRRIVCIYLTGSLLSESPLIGGLTDIDLFIIHDSEPLEPREIVRISDEVHLDIAHYAQSVFRQPRQLRTDPWLGPFIYAKPVVLYDTQHWFEFTQASTGAQFFQPDNILQRASTLAQQARQAWMDMQFNQPENQARRVYSYLQALSDAGNALVSLTGAPLPDRRFMQNLPRALQELDLAELTGQFVQLFAPAPDQMQEALPAWIDGWRSSFLAAGKLEKAPAELHPARRLYYERAAQALAEDNPTSALWTILKSWSLAMGNLPVEAAEAQGWTLLLETLQLGESHFEERLRSLDHYLDKVEEALDAWATENGVSATTVI
jgi:hypothetical protein